MRRLRALLWSLLAYSMVSAFEFSALAAELVWEAPEGCPDRDAIRWRVEDALGVSLDKAAPLRFSAKVVQKRNKRWSVAIDVASESGDSNPQRRELEGASCDDLVQAAAVAIALALGADAQKTSDGAAKVANVDEQHAAEPEGPASVSLIRAAVTPKERQKDRKYRLSAQLGPVFDYQSLPGISPGVQVSAIGGSGGFGVRLGGLVFPTSTTQTSTGPGGRFSLIAGSVALCGGLQRDTGELRLCGGSEMGRLSGKAVNATLSRSGNSDWIAPFAEVAGSSKMTDSIRLFVSLAAVVPLIRRDFEVKTGGTSISIHEPGSVAGRLGLGLELLWQ